MANYTATAIAEGDHWVIDVTGIGTTTAYSINDLEDMAVDLVIATDPHRPRGCTCRAAHRLTRPPSA